MKIRPHRNETYADDSMNFCLSDGSILTPPAMPCRLLFAAWKLENKRKA
jgi:hypothetical protein